MSFSKSGEVEGGFLSSHWQSEVGEAFFGAIQRGDAERVEELLSTHSFLLDQPNSSGQRPLMVALAEGHARVVDILLMNGADYSFTDMSGNSPIHVVAVKGNYEALRVFFKHVALPNINCRNKNGDSVLMGPATKGFSIVVECLLEHSADPNIANETGRTPIMEAAGKGHKEVIKVLIRFGADVLRTCYEDFSGMPTVLKEATHFGSPDITSFVMEHVNMASDRIKKLFECKTTEELDEIIRSGCRVNHQRGDGCTALMVHGESGNLQIVRRLLDSQAFMDTQDKDGQTALMKSSFRGMLFIVQEFVRRGAIINLRCKNGRTALMYGVMGGSLDVTKNLMMAGADSNLTDKNGQSAIDFSESPGISHYIKRTSLPSKMEQDPFTKLMGDYLTKVFKSPPKDDKNVLSIESPPQQRRLEQVKEMKEGATGGREHQSDDEEPIRKHLNTYIKRVAELETRVEELTIQTEFSHVMDDENLSHYETQPQRLIEEYKKLRASKKKAEQFAIDAKQSAQKASVDLAQLKEELQMETHINELKVKQMIQELEATLAATKQTQERREEIEKAYQNIIKAIKSKTTTDVIARMEVENMQKRVYTPEGIFNLIVGGDVKTSFKVMLVALFGLPDSGKTTLVDKLIPKRSHHRRITQGQDEDITMFEAAYSSRSQQQKRLVPQWEEFTRERIYIFMLIQALTNNSRALPLLERWEHVNSLPRHRLDHDHLYEHFKRMYNIMQEGLENFSDMQSDVRFHILSQPTYVLLNLWDTAFKKSLYEALPLIARLVQPFILINVLNLKRDGRGKLRDGVEQSEVHKKQNIMRGRSRGHYFVRGIGLCKCKGKTILIGTHRDELRGREVERMKRLTEAGIRAKAGDVGASESLTSDMLAVNLHDENDIGIIKQRIEDVISESENTFEHDLHLSWIFLRCALMSYKPDNFQMPREEFDDLAYKCGLKSKDEITRCLKFFTKAGSLMHSPEFFPNIVIYNPQTFFHTLNKLYESVDGDASYTDELSTHCKKSLKLGILCKKVVKDIWKEDGLFFWRLMQGAGIAVPTTVLPEQEDKVESIYDYQIECPHDKCKGKKLLYVSTLCTERYYRKEGKCQEEDNCMYQDSLYVTFNTEYIPCDIQAHFVKRMKSKIPDIKLNLTPEYNFTEFEFEDGGLFQVIVHGDVVELVVKRVNEQKRERELKTIIKNTCLVILDTVLKYFPGFQYQIGFICTECLELNDENPPNNNITSYLHFLPTDYASKLYCRYRGEKEFNGKKYRNGCGKMVQLSAGQLRWMTSAGNETQYSTTNTEIYEAAITGHAELVQVVKRIPLDCYNKICTTLGESRLSHAPSDETIVSVLTNWQKRSPSNRREKLARILLRMGCYKAAIKLDPKVHYVTKEEVPLVTTDSCLSPAEIEIICNCAIHWRQLAHELGLAKDRARMQEIETLVCTSDRERCRKVIEMVSTEKDGRQRLIKALNKMKWTMAADSLKLGYTHRYSSSLRVL